MKLLLLGYGKMGQLIEKLALEQGHEISAIVHADNTEILNELDTSNIDVALDFSQPEAAVDNIKWCIDHQIPVAVGTTGWLERKPEVDEYCIQNNGTYLYASNFSIGVNLFFKLNEQLANFMNRQTDYDVRTKEIHHTQKLDAPSGTSITIAEGIIKNLERKTDWKNESVDEDSSELEILSERIDPTPGTHEVTYQSEIDDIQISHTAHSRLGFVKGAIAVANWLMDQKGIKTMEDFLDF